MPIEQESEVVGSSSIRTYQIKGYLFRGYAGASLRRDLLDQVAEGVSPATRAALRAPPPATAWVDGTLLHDVLVALDRLKGVETVREITASAMNLGPVAVLRPVTQGLLRLFGGTPHTIFERLNTFGSLSTRGCELQYSRTGERSGDLTATFASKGEVPHVLFESFAGAVVAMYESFGVSGPFPQLEFNPYGKRNSALFRLSWRSNRM